MVGEFLSDIMRSKGGAEVALRMCLETRGDHSTPHITPLRILGLRPGVPGEESDITVYAWYLDTCDEQAPLNV